jgi:fatty-acyl-CoA synthase
VNGQAELARLRTFTLWRALNDAAARNLERVALVGANDRGEISRLSYAELLTRIRELSAGLAAIGVRRGDRVVLWMTNTPEWVICAFATMRIGAALVPVNTFLKPPEIKYFIEQSGARHLIMIDGFRTLKMPELLAQICASVTSAKTPGFLFSHELPELRNVVLFGRAGGKMDCAFDFAALAANASPQAHELADRMACETQPTDLAMIKYTSGSTAFPKGVMLEHGGIVANAVLHSRRMGVDGSDTYFSMMPFFHAGGSIYGLMTMLLNGGTLVFTEAFNAALAAELVLSERATVFVTMLGDEVVQAALAKGYLFESLRLADVRSEAARKVMPNVRTCFHAFGLTETYGPVALSSYAVGNCDIAGARPLEGNEARIVDPETLEELPAGTAGELLVRGNLTRGYWNKPLETAKAFTKDGWFRSEDLVSIDANGCLTWHGRLKLMLKIGGENVSIEEVERVVTAHESVAACCGVGVPDQRKREALRLYVQTHAGHTLSDSELVAWLKPRLAHFKLPREILFVEALPRLGSGKVDRVHLANLAKSAVPA